MALTDIKREELKLVLNKLAEKVKDAAAKIGKLYNVGIKINIVWEWEDLDESTTRSTESNLRD
jgi:G:T-mismatch repair DNA endonuclease (very short patch repair protein)